MHICSSTVSTFDVQMQIFSIFSKYKYIQVFNHTVYSDYSEIVQQHSRKNHAILHNENGEMLKEPFTIMC